MAAEGIPLDIARLVAEHHEAVYRYAYRLTGSHMDAEDLSQQVFFIACRKGEQLRQADSVRSWLFTILRNCFLKSRAKAIPTPVGTLELSLENLPEPENPPPAIDSEQLQQALNRLPPQDRVILGMFYFENLSYREIAQQLAIPMGTVMSRLSRAKARLRGQLLPQSAHQALAEAKTDPIPRDGPSDVGFTEVRKAGEEKLADGKTDQIPQTIHPIGKETSCTSIAGSTSWGHDHVSKIRGRIIKRSNRS